DLLAPVLEPETDIVVYAPVGTSVSALDDRSAAIFQAGMDDPEDPVFVSLYRLSSDALQAAFPGLEVDADAARVLRSVLMKPEHEAWTDRLADRLEALAA
ncbi:MAG: aspartate aminotransferase family protein, partial [Rubrivirga sp.]